MGSEMPEIKAIVVLDTENTSAGSRLVAKYYNKGDFPDLTAQADFERKLFKKTRNNQARVEAEVALLDGYTCVFKSVADVTFFVVGGGDENELILVSVLDGLVEALTSLLKGAVEKRTLLHNLELLLLCIDELVDGGVILELDPATVEARVMLRGAVPESISSYKEMTVGAVMDKVRDRAAKQFMK